MALIKCPECGKDISDTAVSCVHCGCRSRAAPVKSDGENGCIGCVVAVMLLFFFLYGCGKMQEAKTGKVSSYSAPAKEKYVHKMPFITESINSVWVFYESNVYAKPEEKDPVGFVRRKASVAVQSVQVNGEYDWVKIVDAPVRPLPGCNLSVDGDYLKKPKGLYMKRFDLITSSPENWPVK